MPKLFSPLTQRSVTFRNRIGISPMCQYSCVDGMPTDWHLVHLGSRAVGGAGLVIAEASGVEPIGRITPADAGIWNDAQAEAWARITRFIGEQGSVPGIQLAHAGRKASTRKPWEGHDGIPIDQGGWQTIGPSPINFTDSYIKPTAMTLERIGQVREKFVASAKLALHAGFKVLEIHAAHGYLLHSFYSPLSNQRTDAYGGSFDNRIRLLVEIATAVRAVMPDDLPLWTRLSCSDWVEGGWTIEESVELSKRLKSVGVDCIDASSGGNIPKAPIPNAPGYQVPFAARIRRSANVATAAVGLIVDAQHAAKIIDDGDADMVLLGRQSLREPYFPLHAVAELGAKEALKPPVQYERAF
ncbi:MAG TPA: NADH:flavin oxidoreductase/NADH oxidase [Tepidisphaeraceae bacterium]|jgi:2,4-dienoyl-CoA reductase-like NADH-dependent reductase (Old Yellow Enzyme family)